MSGARDVPGVLAIWHDCTPGSEETFERWYRTEHLAERVGIEGFVAGWRYVAVEGSPGYLTHYETTSPSVLRSAAYRARLDAPTPLTRQVMSGAFVNVIRTICARRARLGAARGAYASVARFDAAIDAGGLESALPALADGTSVTRAELWVAAGATDAAASAEQSLRGPDETITACVSLETTDESAARAAAARLSGALTGAAAVGVYRLLCALDARDVD